MQLNLFQEPFECFLWGCEHNGDFVYGDEDGKKFCFVSLVFTIDACVVGDAEIYYFVKGALFLCECLLFQDYLKKFWYFCE